MSTDMMWQINSTGSANTQRLGELLGSMISGQQVIELRADLGGGKTTFTRGLARGLGSEDPVSSPTFTLKKAYKCRDDLEIHHYDFYRLNEPGVVSDQLAESLSDGKVITIVEWSDIVENVLPDDRIIVEFKPDDSDSEKRSVGFTYTDSSLGLMRKLETQWQRVAP